MREAPEAGARSYVNRVFERKRQARLRRNVHALALGGHLRGSTHTGAAGCSYGGSLSATRERTDDRAQGRCSADHLSAPASPRAAFARDRLGVYIHDLSVHKNGNQIERQLGLAADLAGLLVIYQLDHNVRATGNHLLVTHDHRLIDAGPKSLAHVADLRIHWID